MTTQSRLQLLTLSDPLMQLSNSPDPTDAAAVDRVTSFSLKKRVDPGNEVALRTDVLNTFDKASNWTFSSAMYL